MKTTALHTCLLLILAGPALKASKESSGLDHPSRIFTSVFVHTHPTNLPKCESDFASNNRPTEGLGILSQRMQKGELPTLLEIRDAVLHTIMCCIHPIAQKHQALLDKSVVDSMEKKTKLYAQASLNTRCVVNCMDFASLCIGKICSAHERSLGGGGPLQKGAPVLSKEEVYTLGWAARLYRLIAEFLPEQKSKEVRDCVTFLRKVEKEFAAMGALWKKQQTKCTQP
ncbi:uncharacterized protein NEMAJ01_0476 [Nematocida major]|uniref:uncharacterized protein n=1 Tax=Nematocida major TaxID=1912982 RepID=UPI00200791FF|nr:uncharacterized protein NEMAJ01_0476 [Nematocida major]KAH9385580.1 hypothetical protein NEMAJ01_0476 [Nematocida major]